jgi:hypothetical protein
MGHSDPKAVVAAITAYRRGIEQARLAKFAETLLLKDAARAAAEAGMSVREFAKAAGISKSRAGRELRASPWPYAVRSENVPAIDAALEAARRDDARVLPLRAAPR